MKQQCLPLSTQRSTLHRLALPILLLALLFLSIASLSTGAVTLHLAQIFAYLTDQSSKLTQIILSTIRIPRTITAIAAGAALGTSGLLLQTTTKNNLACPTILGINQGASLTALGLLIWFPTISYGFYFFLVTLGGLCAFFLTALFSMRQRFSTTKLILIGTSFNALFYGLTYLLIITFPTQAQNLLFVLHGTLASSHPNQAHLLLEITTACIVIVWLFRYRLNHLAADEQTLHSLGQSPLKSTLPFNLLAVLLASSVAGVVGPVFFFGLVIPHIAKLIFGKDIKNHLVKCAILGSITLLVTDLLIRVLFNGTEISVSIIFAFLSTPVLILLLKTTKL